MKLRTTTPASIPFMAKSLLVVSVILMAFAIPIQISNTVYARDFQGEIDAIQQEIDKAQAQQAQFASQAHTYQTAVAQLQNQAAIIQAQIDLSQAKHDKLVVDIANTEKKIKDNQDALGETIANLYVDGKISPLEMLASSKNVGDYLDKQEYRNSVRDQLTSTIAQIKDLKIQLDQQKVDVERVIGDENNSKAALVAKQGEQQTLLDQTQGQEAAYQQLAAASQARQNDVRAQQQAAIAAAIGSTGGATLLRGGAAGDYPWGSSNCPMTGYYSLGGSDGNGGDGHSYGCRQCASYAAWRVAKETGNYPVNWGNAINFPASARSVGYQTGSSPRAGSLAVMGGSPEGHVAWVEAVNGDGTIVVSQYNYNYGAGWGMYSEMRLSASVFSEYVYIK